MRLIGAIGLVVVLFLTVYVPVFVLISELHISQAAIVPTIIVGTSLIALSSIGWFGWWRKLTLADFGIRVPVVRYFVRATLISVPLSTLAALGAARIHERDPLQGIVLAPALTYLYFGLGAPVQEEIIFRGLLQTVLVDRLQNTAVAASAGVLAVIIVGLLFALIHLELGPFTAACALVLALVAGEFRRRSTSIAPGILCHAIFNLAAMVR
jgi:membrane protease YdiL (CAAX protease family)